MVWNLKWDTPSALNLQEHVQFDTPMSTGKRNSLYKKNVSPGFSEVLTWKSANYFYIKREDFVFSIESDNSFKILFKSLWKKLSEKVYHR